MEGKFTGWGIVAVVFFLILAFSVETGGMMNLHGGTIVASQSAEGLSQIEPAAGKECYIPQEMMGKPMNKVYFSLQGIDYNAIEQGSDTDVEDPTHLNIYIDSKGKISDMKCG